MNPIRSYVIRIYRQERHDIAGVVEDVQSGKSTFFQSFAVLRTVLTTRARARPTVTEDGGQPAAKPQSDH